jgi:hypothetical protein
MDSGGDGGSASISNILSSELVLMICDLAILGCNAVTVVESVLELSVDREPHSWRLLHLSSGQ